MDENKFNFNFAFMDRFLMYKEMTKYEPRMWTKNHHIIYVGTNIFMATFFIYSFIKIYYSYSFGFVENIKVSSKNKFLLASTLIILPLGYLVNNKYLDHFIYDKYYNSDLVTDSEFLKMYDELVSVKKLKDNL
jgi:hypothetical protein